MSKGVNRHKFRLIVLALIILATASFLICLNVTSRAWRAFAPLREDSPDEAEYSVIFDSVQRGLLAPDAAGAVKLPAQSADATRDGHAYVTRKGTLLLVLFPTWLGKGSNLRGYLYTNRPLAATDIHKDYYSGTADAIILNLPGPWSKSIPAVPDEVEIEHRQGTNQYYVSRSLD